MKVSFLFLIIIFSLNSCRKDNPYSFCNNHTPVFKNGHEVYLINKDFHPDNEYLSYEIDLNCDYQNDLTFNTSDQVLSGPPTGHLVKSSINLVHEDIFLLGSFYNDTTYLKFDTIWPSSSNSFYYISEYTCAFTDTIKSVENKVHLNYASTSDDSVAGEWINQSFEIYHNQLDLFTETVFSSDSTFVWVDRFNYDCDNLLSGNYTYIFWKLDNENESTEGYIKMDGPFFIAEIGVKI